MLSTKDNTLMWMLSTEDSTATGVMSTKEFPLKVRVLLLSFWGTLYFVTECKLWVIWINAIFSNITLYEPSSPRLCFPNLSPLN